MFSLNYRFFYCLVFKAKCSPSCEVCNTCCVVTGSIEARNWAEEVQTMRATVVTCVLATNN